MTSSLFSNVHKKDNITKRKLNSSESISDPHINEKIKYIKISKYRSFFEEKKPWPESSNRHDNKIRYFVMVHIVFFKYLNINNIKIVSLNISHEKNYVTYLINNIRNVYILYISFNKFWII